MKDSLKIYFAGALVLSISLFILAFLNPHAGIDIQEQDVYFVISMASFYNGLGLLLLLKVALMFLIKSKTKSNRFLGCNLLIDIGLIAFGLCAKYYHSYYAVPRRYYRFDSYQSFSNISTSLFYQTIIAIGILCMLNQLFFILIITFNYIKRQKKNGQKEE
ncbi:MAG: hypothetical protein JKY03_09850 [Aureispira sp.]|nr:hypothetical protein [Aureispira sp.]